MKSTDTARFTFVPHWKKESAENDETVLAFWKREGALANEAQAKERLSQVILHACDSNGDIAGVCTAVPMDHPRLGQPMYYYRCFIGKTWRKTRLLMFMAAQAVPILEEYAAANGYPCVGVLVELENDRFAKKWRMPVWPYVPFVYIGKSQRNLEVRVCYFQGARLKKPK